MILILLKLIGMDSENKMFPKKTFLFVFFVAIIFMLSSCDILSYSESKQDFLNLTGTYTVIPNDSIVTIPQLRILDTALYKSFDEVLYLTSVYLTHAKNGEKTWYEVKLKTNQDTIIIDIYAHQYRVEDRVREGKYTGVFQYKENKFLIKTDSIAGCRLISYADDSLTFNSAYRGTVVYNILDRNYNYPEFIFAKYAYHNGKTETIRIEINNYIYSNGCFYKKK